MTADRRVKTQHEHMRIIKEFIIKGNTSNTDLGVGLTQDISLFYLSSSADISPDRHSEQNENISRF